MHDCALGCCQLGLNFALVIHYINCILSQDRFLFDFHHTIWPRTWIDHVIPFNAATITGNLVVVLPWIAKTFNKLLGGSTARCVLVLVLFTADYYVTSYYSLLVSNIHLNLRLPSKVWNYFLLYYSGTLMSTENKLLSVQSQDTVAHLMSLAIDVQP